MTSRVCVNSVRATCATTGYERSTSVQHVLVRICRLACFMPVENSVQSVSFVTYTILILSEISGSHGGEYEDGCLLGCSAV
jgi:hypothetical protein